MKLSFPLTPRRVFRTLLAPACFFQLLNQQVAYAYDCFHDQFPLNFGNDIDISKMSHVCYEINDAL